LFVEVTHDLLDLTEALVFARDVEVRGRDDEDPVPHPQARRDKAAGFLLTLVDALTQSCLFLLLDSSNFFAQAFANLETVATPVHLKHARLNEDRVSDWRL
jgi:hypothetical protein